MTEVDTTCPETTCADKAFLSRRGLFSFSAGAALAATLLDNSPALAEEDHSSHEGHHGPAKHQALIDAALLCVNRGDVCTAHCIALMSTGDTSIKDCLRSVSAMLPMCRTLASLAAQDAQRLKEFAKVCSDVCADCEAECKKHAEKHAACKACMESCTECIKACKSVIES